MASFYSGDPYIGSRSEELKMKQKEIDALTRENKQLRQELEKVQAMSYNRGRQGGAQGGSSSYRPPGDRTATEKRSRY